MVSVSEMARQCGLSRSRFYQLVGTTFPFPVYDIASRRPGYTEELQQVCLDVRRHNCGIDGKAVMFYARRVLGKPRVAPAKTKAKHADLIDAIKSLGLSVTAGQVEAAVTELFPNGTDRVNHGEVIRSVFVHLKKTSAKA